MAAASSRRQRPRLREDPLSALPDDLLVNILHRLDTRSALATSVLARRWARLPRRLRALDFRVSDLLPPSYHESLALVARNPDIVEEHTRRAMASFTDCVHNFVEEKACEGWEPRRVERLRLEFFDPDDPLFMDGVIATAVLGWGVEDLEVVVKPVRPPPLANGVPLPHMNCYRFPYKHLVGVESKQRIRRLTLGGFSVVPTMRRFRHLTQLVLQDVGRPMRAEAYGSIFSRCPQLRCVHLRRCRTRSHEGNNNQPSIMNVDAPASEIRELVVDSCTFVAIRLTRLPLLDRLACSGKPIMLNFGHVPRLAHVNLSFSITEDDIGYDDDYTVDDLMGGSLAPSMADLVVRFTGPIRWITTRVGLGGATSAFHALRRLLVADMPCVWDVSWPCLILEAAPFLEVLHLSIVTWCGGNLDMTGMQGFEIGWEPSRFRHHHLKELVLVGFEQETRQACLVKYTRKVCMALQRVVLVKGGHVEVRDLWGGWKVMAAGDEDADHSAWSEEEKLAVKREIKGARYLKQYGQLIFA